MPVVHEPVQKPRLFFLVIFFSFFFGMLNLSDSLAFFAQYFSPEREKFIHELLEQTLFTTPQILGLTVYQLLSSLGILWTTWLLMSRHSEFGRKTLKALYVIDVFLFIGILFYFYHFQYQPPDADLFYYSVASTLFEILLIICLSHPSMLELTRESAGTPSSESKEKQE